MTLDTFEQALLDELRQRVGSRAAPTPSRSRRRWALAALPVGAAGAVAVALTLGGPSAAYAVEKGDNGDIVVTIHRLDDAAGLEKALKAEGVEADVDYDAALADDPQPPAGMKQPDDEASLQAAGAPPTTGPCAPPKVEASSTDDSFTLRIPASAVGFRGVLHITTSGSLDDGPTALRVWGSRPAGC